MYSLHARYTHSEVELRKCCLGQSEKSKIPYHLINIYISLIYMIDVQLDISYISLIYTRLMHDIYAVRYIVPAINLHSL